MVPLMVIYKHISRAIKPRRHVPTVPLAMLAPWNLPRPPTRHLPGGYQRPWRQQNAEEILAGSIYLIESI